MEPTKGAIIIVAIAVLGMAAALHFTNFLSPTIAEFDMFLNVSDYIGVSADTDAAYFGTVFPGASSSRGVKINGSKTSTTIVKIQTSGELSKHLYIAEKKFELMPGESRRVKLTVKAPEDAVNGASYKGKILIYTREKSLIESIIEKLAE